MSRESVTKSVNSTVRCLGSKDRNKRIKVYYARQMLGYCKYPPKLFVKLERNL